MLASSRVSADSALAPRSSSRLRDRLKAWNGDCASGVSPKPAMLAGSVSIFPVIVTCSAAWAAQVACTAARASA